MSYDSASALLKKYGQSHLLHFWDVLDEAARSALLVEIDSLDLSLVAKLHRDLVTSPSSQTSDPSILQVTPLRGVSPSPSEQSAFQTDGLEALSRGTCAAFLVAGGQGTRLGHDGPKGMFDINLPSGKSLFQLQAERLLRLGTLCGKAVPWYIMTSRENHTATTEFFRAHNHFGLAEDQIMFFQQAEFPLTDENGKILLAQKGRIAMGPNGNGGCFPALQESGALADMKRRGVEWIFIYSVDNALVRVCDPTFLGFARASGLPAASKSVAKAAPEERVGVFCRRDGRPSVIEYSEMSPETCAARDMNGLLYGSANIAVHLFRRDFLEQHATAALPWHVAHKKIPFITVDSPQGVGQDNAPGSLVTPTTPNAYKFELFMFDLFPMAPDMAVWEVDRAAEFAPVKNREGADSPATARRMILDLHRTWAVDSGVSSATLEGLDVEVSPLTSYAGEGLTPLSFHRDDARHLVWA
jgi:UDP-N-acetylglucosamine/UDP-N-acetylgalactosamine diphosphorylase